MKPINQYTSEELRAFADEQEILEKNAKRPKPLDNIELQPLVKLAEEHLTSLIAGDEDEDFPQWCYEALMEAVYGRKIFEFINKL